MRVQRDESQRGEHIVRCDDAARFDARLFQCAGQQAAKGVRADLAEKGGFPAEFRHGGKEVRRCAAGMGGHRGIAVGIRGTAGKIDQKLA